MQRMPREDPFLLTARFPSVASKPMGALVLNGGKKIGTGPMQFSIWAVSPERLIERE
jgi:hypothetical protein